MQRLFHRLARAASSAPRPVPCCNGDIVAKDEKTSKKVATEAFKVLRDPKIAKIKKGGAGSTITQTADKKAKISTKY
jgi:hypothetical protein